MGVPEIEEFLTHLAVEGNVAAATQNQALNAILFLYRQVLQIELDNRINAIRAKRSQQIPVVLSPDEAFAIIQQTTGVHRLMLQLLYGSGLRLRECMELRIKDIDFAQCQNYDDLYPCAKSWWVWCCKSTRSLIARSAIE
jgi:site-specific recombinase XerD